MTSELRRKARMSSVGALLTLCVIVTPLATAQELTPFKNYLVTGDYVAAGVGLRGRGVNGFATGDITIEEGVGANRIPAGAEVVAAYLYWQTITTRAAPVNPEPAAAGARFDGYDLSQIAVRLGAGTAPCWSDGGSTGASNGSKVTASFRADVLRFFPRRRPATPDQPVTVQVAGTHTVTLPDQGNSNQLPSTLGAGLVVVYRVPGYAAPDYRTPKQPSRYVVLYDGGYTLNNDQRQLALTLEGFYEASRTAPAARMTQLVADGQANKTERVQIRSTTSPADNTVVAVNPFRADTGFEAVTFEGLPLENGAMKATLTVDGGGSGSFDCLSWSSVVMSTEVQDLEGDGLLDVWEARSEWATKPNRLSSVYAAWPLADPEGNPLPNLELMGANPRIQDVFVQVDYMTGPSHSHLPSRTALQSVATAFRNAAPRPSLVAKGLCTENAAPGQCPINIHFDVGTSYQPPASCATWTPDCAFVPSNVAKGGNAIPEVACTDASCAFPGMGGVVRWKTGLRAFRDATVNGEPRFARSRKDTFRYGLFAHALGIPSLTNPRVPRKTSGIADSFGADFAVTLGLWDNQTGTAPVQAATLMHELGHTFGLGHGGIVPSNQVEPNCKPNYQSVMNYLFQVRGLLTWQGQPTLDYSRQQLSPLSETSLSEPIGLGVRAEYLPRWYAPSSTSFIDRALNTSPATRRCDGTPITDPLAIGYVRVDADTRSGVALDWNADGTIQNTWSQDVNFDGKPGQALAGANDYWTMDLRQVGARRAVGSESLHESVVDRITGESVGGGLSLDTGYGDLGYGDLGYGDLGYGDLGYGDLGYGDLGYGDLGYGDLGYGDLGYGDLGVPADVDDPLAALGDLNLETAGALANAPSGLVGTRLKGKAGIKLDWLAPTVGNVVAYQIYRVVGTGVTPANFAQRVLVANIGGGITSLTDATLLKNNTAYTYFVVATLAPLPDCGTSCSNLQSGVSNFVTVVY